MTDPTRQCQCCDRPAVHGGLCAACIADEMEPDDYGDPEGPAFECAGFTDMLGEFYCPMWGSEECDWECPNGGMG